jgi:hypothetical protein
MLVARDARGYSRASSEVWRVVSWPVSEQDVEVRWVELAEFTPDGGWGLRYRSMRSLLA